VTSPEPDTTTVSLGGYTFTLAVDDLGQLSIAREGRMIAAVGLDVAILDTEPPPPRFGESEFDEPFVPEEPTTEES
jgi:hypothetical protein